VKKLKLIVNGIPIEREYAPDTPLHAIKQDGLTATANLGQPPERWDLCDLQGNRLRENVELRNTWLENNVLFVSLKAGIAA
jgi:hypothetical protein